MAGAFEDEVIGTFELGEARANFCWNLRDFGQAPIHSLDLYQWARDIFKDALAFEDYRFNDHDWAEFPRLAKLAKRMGIEITLRWTGRKAGKATAEDSKFKLLKEDQFRYRVVLLAPPPEPKLPRRAMQVAH